LRGSAGFAPASQSSSSEEDARTNFKSIVNVIAGGAGVKRGFPERGKEFKSSHGFTRMNTDYLFLAPESGGAKASGESEKDLRKAGLSVFIRVNPWLLLNFLFWRKLW
jgi:hypothetical protein